MLEWYEQALDVLATPPMANRNADLLRRATASLAQVVLGSEVDMEDGQGVCAILGVPASSVVEAGVIRQVARNGREVPLWRELTADKKTIICTNCPINQDCAFVPLRKSKA